jgi:hypothetical protein
MSQVANTPLLRNHFWPHVCMRWAVYSLILGDRKLRHSLLKWLQVKCLLRGKDKQQPQQAHPRRKLEYVSTPSRTPF